MAGPGRGDDDRDPDEFDSTDGDDDGRIDVPTPSGAVVRRAREGETVAVLRVLEGALLDVEVATVRAAVAGGDAFVAVRDADPATGGRSGSTPDDGEETPDDGGEPPVVVGALVRTCADRDRSTATETRTVTVEAVAVRPSWRGRGVGTALVEAAAGDVDRLTATFRPSVRPFYASLGFELTGSADEDRVVGVLDRTPDG